MIAIADAVRPNAKHAVEKLTQMGIQVAMLVALNVLMLKRFRLQAG